MDAATGLYNYDARLYDPVVGRFVSPDSIIPDIYNPQSLNRYSYVLNNPLKYTDPTGHQGSSVLPRFGFMPPYYDTPEMQQGRNRDVLRITQWLKSRYNEDAVLAVAWRYYKGLFQQSEDTGEEGEVEKGPDFVVDETGVAVDPNKTPKGTYKQPDGSETDILQDKPHHNKKKNRNDGNSHTHPKEKNVAPDGRVFEKRSKDTHPVTKEEVDNIVNGDAEKIK